MFATRFKQKIKSGLLNLILKFSARTWILNNTLMEENFRYCLCLSLRYTGAPYFAAISALKVVSVYSMSTSYYSNCLPLCHCTTAVFSCEAKICNWRLPLTALLLDGKSTDTLQFSNFISPLYLASVTGKWVNFNSWVVIWLTLLFWATNKWNVATSISLLLTSVLGGWETNLLRVLEFWFKNAFINMLAKWLLIHGRVKDWPSSWSLIAAWGCFSE